jgi:drug/metabolite transporter (DMT)-like permease
MELHVVLAVMAAAAMHAGWNALLKSGGDPFDCMARISLFGGMIAVVGVTLVQFPVAAAWPWIALSWVLHAAYRFFLIAAYRAGDLSQVYPIARGTAPLLTAMGTALLLSETLPALGYAGIAALATGVFLMSMKGSRAGGFDVRAVGFALATAITICSYTIVDGYGARLNGSAASFILWEMFGNSIIMGATALGVRGRTIYAGIASWWLPSAGAAAMSTTSYIIATWAMTKAPIALVAALRETGVLYAALIGVVFLGEPMTRWRWGAATIIVAGVVLLRLS